MVCNTERWFRMGLVTQMVNLKSLQHWKASPLSTTERTLKYLRELKDEAATKCGLIIESLNTGRFCIRPRILGHRHHDIECQGKPR